MCDSCSPNWEPPSPGDGEVFYPEDTRQILEPAPTVDLAALGRSLGYAAQGRLCVRCGIGEIVEGGYCVRCAEWAFGEAS